MKIVLKAVGDGSFNVYKDGVLYAKELPHSEALATRKYLVDGLTVVELDDGQEMA